MSQREPVPTIRETAAARHERAALALARLHEIYPDSKTALTFDSPWQLLIATILSAQCTDERVNLATPALFARFPDALATAGADISELEELVRSTGFYRQKAKNVLATARRVVDVYDGEIPDTVAELTTLPGAARKTANVVISNCWPERMEGIAVDTHVQRIARRLAWTRSFPPEQVERDLMRVIDRSEWQHLTHLLIDHGRAICTARKPTCQDCPVLDLCPSGPQFLAGTRTTSRKPAARRARRG